MPQDLRKRNGPPPNPPRKHHYIPSFYLSRWCTRSDRLLCQYSKPNGHIVPNRRAPSATGFVDKLYELKGLAPDLSSVVETEFFKPVDTAAADALALIEADGNRAKWDSRRRTAWSIFLHSLLVRSPEDVAILKQTWHELLKSDVISDWEEHYQKVRQPEDAQTFLDHMNSQPDDLFDRSAMKTLVSILDGSNVARRMFGMKWHVVDTSNVDFTFLTSDRPVIRTNGLLIDGGHLALPIAPRKLFIAARDEEALRRLLTISKRQLVREVNRQVCDHAVKYVWGIDDSQLSYVKKHFATKEQPQLACTNPEQRRRIAERMRPPSSLR